ncbi:MULTISPECIES: rhodanese-like domain-containing protein [Actinomadura]|uniref:Rhodanese-like domain-containing protein n=1 Tax=Actinomadura livida TaxID=79909 RepID=A0A7W7I713_9ACTN|nr:MULTISPECIES: rhodanese-like domain-containing protein [Actinomadura]MBB4771630.1 rhodanese-related sulfurtransferase [Actinomadura catellatispora]TDB93332.1 rhodanese-like domain-containing protein [Actinomadura sp. 7K534]GGU01480.1 sulfurtransferase [Actinomadura livida]
MNFGDDVPAVRAADVPQDAYLLDVREQYEWDAGHAPAAVHIPMGRLGDRAGEVPRDQEVFVICRSGARSAQVTVALNQAGWLAKNVDGGMKGWAEAGRPMEGGGDGPPHVA